MIFFLCSLWQNHRKGKPVVEIVGFLEQQNCVEVVWYESKLTENVASQQIKSYIAIVA